MEEQSDWKVAWIELRRLVEQECLRLYVKHLLNSQPAVMTHQRTELRNYCSQESMLVCSSQGQGNCIWAKLPFPVKSSILQIPKGHSAGPSNRCIRLWQSLWHRLKIRQDILTCLCNTLGQLSSFLWETSCRDRQILQPLDNIVCWKIELGLKELRRIL